jgi:hypothetical protein
MRKNSYPKNEQLSIADVMDCVKEHLERAGYNVTTIHKSGIGANLTGIKDKETFVVQAVGSGESSNVAQEKEILCAVGEMVRQMKDGSMWTSYGIAIPMNYLKFLKDFEVGGIQLLNLHFFVVETLWSLYHLDSKATIELIQNLKVGKPEDLIDLDIDFKNFDYMI